MVQQQNGKVLNGTTSCMQRVCHCVSHGGTHSSVQLSLDGFDSEEVISTHDPFEILVT